MNDILILQSSIHQEAFIWFIPIIWIAISAAGVFMLYSISTIWDTDSGDKLGMAVLGMPQAGKTLWYSYLTNKEMAKHTVDRTQVDEFTLYFPKGRQVTIRNGIDIGGNEENIRTYYSQMICNNEIVLFFFNIKSYLDDISYQRKVNSRLDYIYTCWKKNKTGVDPSKKVSLIMSYADLLGNNREDGCKNALNLLRSRTFSEITKQYIIINMMDDKEKGNLKIKLFGGDSI
mgnify:CR=1 FL=1